MITVVLVRATVPGNIGAIARVMANFNMTRLILVHPECDHQCKEALDRAKHAKNILIRAHVVPDLASLPQFDSVIGTTAQLGTEYNIPRSPLMLLDAARAVNLKSKIALVFGSEGTGLTNEELSACDFITTVRTAKRYPTLNLSHAVAIVLYEFFASANKNPHSPASSVDKKTVWRYFTAILDKIAFPTPEKKHTQQKVWKKVFAKAMLTKRESFAIIGMLKKIIEYMK